MPINVGQFQKAFIEESLDMLEKMEKALLSLDIKSVEAEKINEIFRVAHSIKSNSAVFDFTSISSFAHLLEDYLDEIRSGKRSIDQQGANLLLKSVDCIRSMILDAQQGRPIIDQCAKKLTEDLSQLLSDQAATIQRFKLLFHPPSSFWQLKNEPFRLFMVLSELGELTKEVNIGSLPPFGTFNPEECHLAWKLILSTTTPKQEIQAIFDWVTEKENIEISNLDDSNVEERIETEKSQPPIEKPEKKKLSSVSSFEMPNFSTIRVATEKIDALVNIIGELAITQSTIRQLSKDLNARNSQRLQEELANLENKSRTLQEIAMRMRMLPVGFALSRLARLVKDFTNKTGKQLELKISGEQTELDKYMLEKIVDPILHLVRNAIDHGIEMPEAREAIGKPATGVLEICIYQQDSSVNIDVIDDGRGLDKEKIRLKAIAKNLISPEVTLSDEDYYRLICHPGFSTREDVTEISGRGVGMDVVLKNVQELGGRLEIQSDINRGTIVHLVLPLTLAIMDCQLVKIKNQTYVIPLFSIIEIIKIERENLSYFRENTEFYHFRDVYVPVVRLGKLFSLVDTREELLDKFIVIISVEDHLFGFIVDDLLVQQQIVIKNLEDNYQKVPGIVGGTILGDGDIGLIIDINGVVELIRNTQNTVISSLIKQADNQDFIANETAPDAQPEEEVLVDQLLTFIMQGEEYGINILSVKEILSWKQPTPLPNTAPYVKGVINLRGEIVPVIDLLNYLQLGDLKDHQAASIIILNVNDKAKPRMIGIMIDLVSNAYSIGGHPLMPVENFNQSKLIKYVKGLVTINDRLITVLNINAALSII